MDLKVEEVSELLNVPESLLVEWIAEGKIPAYRIRNHYRFNRQEIENWVLKQGKKEAQSSGTKKGQRQFNLYKAIHKGDVIVDFSGKTKNNIISQIAERIALKLHLSGEVLASHILEREKLVPTALGFGFGIPHARDFLLRSSFDSVTCVFLEDPIEYGALDNEPVHTLFFLLASDDRRHLALLSKIAYLVQTPEMREFFATKPDKRVLLPFIKEWESSLQK